jgi:hypothetical protein
VAIFLCAESITLTSCHQRPFGVADTGRPMIALQAGRLRHRISPGSRAICGLLFGGSRPQPHV